MAVFRILGDEVLTGTEFAARLARGDFTPKLKAMEARAAADTGPGATQFVPIGLNKPLTILIRHVYTGRHPTGFGSGGKEMVLVTGLKDYSVFAASSRAVNFLMRDIRPRTHFRAPSAFTDGTNVVAYSPAVVTDSFHFTVEMAFDRFPHTLFSTISSALGQLAGIPLFIPAQGFLLAASSVLKIGSEWADALVDGRASFSITDTLDFNMPGVTPPTADFRVMCNFRPTNMKFEPGTGLIQSNGEPYAGDEPYVIVSLDGAPRKNLEKFSQTVASAAVLKQFFSMRDGGEASVEALVSAIRLANDMKFREEAKDIPGLIEQETDDKKKAELQKRLDALNRNILSPELKLH